MLLVTLFTFFGLSAIQNLSYFSSLLGDVKICVSFMNEEEENENSNNEEVKEIKEKIDDKRTDHSLSQIYERLQLMHRSPTLKTLTIFNEVSTPPPEVIT